MSATIVIQSAHGGSSGSPGSTSTVTSFRMKAADNDTADTNNPMIKPASGTNYSYEKWIRLNCSVAPANVVNNIRFHRASGSPSTGITDFYGEVAQATGYSVPVGTLSSVATTAMPVVATAVTLDTGDNTSTGQFGPWIVLQWRLSTSVSAGTQASLTYRFTYDES